MKRLKVGDKVFIYFHGYKVTGIVKFTEFGPREGEYWHDFYGLEIDDEHIIENYDTIQSIELFFQKDKTRGSIHRKVRGNDINLDVERIREERLKKLLDKKEK
jgi:hypothetical protein